MFWVKGYVAVVVHEAIAVQVPVQVELERKRDLCGRAIIIGLHRQSVRIVRLDPAIAVAAVSAATFCMVGVGLHRGHWKRGVRHMEFRRQRPRCLHLLVLVNGEFNALCGKLRGAGTQ
jgi:hypothetical protein